MTVLYMTLSVGAIGVLWFFWRIYNDIVRSRLFSQIEERVEETSRTLSQLCEKNPSWNDFVQKIDLQNTWAKVRTRLLADSNNEQTKALARRFGLLMDELGLMLRMQTLPPSILKAMIAADPLQMITDQQNTLAGIDQLLLDIHNDLS